MNANAGVRVGHFFCRPLRDSNTTPSLPSTNVLGYELASLRDYAWRFP